MADHVISHNNRLDVAQIYAAAAIGSSYEMHMRSNRFEASAASPYETYARTNRFEVAPWYEGARTRDERRWMLAKMKDDPSLTPNEIAARAMRLVYEQQKKSMVKWENYWK